MLEYRFGKKFKKDSGEENPLGVHRNIRGCILEVNCEELRGNRQYVYHFVDPDLRVEIILKKRGRQKMGALIMK